MKILRPILILASCLTFAANAAAQISLTPPGVDTPPADKPAAKANAKPAAAAKKPAAPAATPNPAAPGSEARGKAGCADRDGHSGPRA
jgi:hypothetical protein